MTETKQSARANDPTKNRLRITVSTNGPYLVSGPVRLLQLIIAPDATGDPCEWRVGKKFELQEKCTLCRCGRSRNKPFCDGSHLKTGFDGTETAGEESYIEQARVFEGPGVDLTDVELLCASARFCHRGGGIWSLTPKSDDKETRQLVIEEACDCPSGRLVVWDKETKRALEPELEPSIGLIEDPQMGVSGPIWVRGGISIESAEGKVYEIRNRMTLCRCGKSTNKPFCDSSHYPEEHEHGGKSDE